MADRIVRIGLGVAVNVALARALGPADYGLFAYALTVGALFLPLSTLGLERIVVRELARARGPEGVMLGSIAAARLLGGLSGCGLAVAVAVVAAGAERALVAGLVALITAGNLLQAFDVIDWSFQARRDFKHGTAARLAAFVVAATLKVVLALGGGGLMALGVITLFEMVLSAAFQWIVWLRCSGSMSAWKVDAALGITMMRLAAPLLVGEIAIWLFQKADTLILQYVAGEAEVGLYAVAQRLGQAAYFLPVLAVQIFSPQVARAADEAAALALVQRVMNGLVGAAYAISFGLWLASALLVRGLFGSAYVAAAPLLAWLAWSNVFVFMGCAHTLYLVNRDAQKMSLWLAWLTALTSIGLNLLLVPALHARGAALANVAAYALTTVFGVALFPQSRPLLAVNLRALAAPLWLVADLIHSRRAGSPS